MRVCHLIAPGPIAGAETVVLGGGRALADAGVDVSLCVVRETRDPRPGDDFMRLAGDRGLRTRALDVRGRLDAGAIARLRAHLSERCFDVLHVHGYKAAFYATLAWPPRLPTVATDHGMTAHTLSVRLYERLLLLLYRRMWRVIAVSEASRRDLLRRGLSPWRVVTIENFVSVPEGAMDQEPPDEPSSHSPRPLRLLYLGRLSPEKGASILLEALAIARDGPVHLTVVGDGPERPALEHLARRLGLGASVEFAGYQARVGRFLAASDAIVLPSLREGMPVAVLEALAAGRPVLASAVGGVPEVVQDGRTGILVPPGDRSALAAGIRRLARERDDFARAARADAPRARERYGPTRWAERVVALYEQAVMPAQSTGRGGSGRGAMSAHERLGREEPHLA